MNDESYASINIFKNVKIPVQYITGYSHGNRSSFVGTRRSHTVYDPKQDVSYEQIELTLKEEFIDCAWCSAVQGALNFIYSEHRCSFKTPENYITVYAGPCIINCPQWEVTNVTHVDFPDGTDYIKWIRLTCYFPTLEYLKEKTPEEQLKINVSDNADNDVQEKEIYALYNTEYLIL